MDSKTVANEIPIKNRMSPELGRRDLFMVALFAALVFLPFLGTSGMFDPTDSFFIESGREMLETHKFIVPLMNYEQWLDKPALDFCMIAASLATFGTNEFAGRLPAALSGILEVIVLFVLSSQLLTRRQAFLSSLVLVATPLYIVVGRTSLSDEPLSLFLTTSLLSFAIASIKKSPVFLLLAYGALGVAILLKGPPLTVVLSGLVLTGYLLWSRRTRFFSAAFELKPVQGLVASFCIALPYYLWAHFGTNGEFTTNFFLRQNLGRATGALNHVRPFWWYIPILLGGIFPWSLLLLFAGKYLKKVNSIGYTISTRRQELLKFACCWAVLGLAFFSAVPTKLETYIVPVLPSIALLTGCFLDVLIRATHARSSRVVSFIMLGAVSFVAIASPIAIQVGLDKSGQYLMIDIAAAVVIIGICAWGAWQQRQGMINGLNRLTTARPFYALLAAVIFLCGVFIPVLFVAYHKAYQQPIDDLVQYARSQHADLAVAYFPMPSVIYRYDHAIPVIKSRKEMLDYAEAQPDRRWVLINRDVLDLLDWTERSPRLVAHEGRWWLFAVGRNCTKENTVEWHGPGKGPYPKLSDKH